MRVRIKISINDAESICRYLMTLANNTNNLLIKQQLHLDFVKLHNHLALKDRSKGNKMTGFTLDGLTLCVLNIDMDKILPTLFDEPTQYMIRYAIGEVQRSAESSLMKTKMQI